MSFQKRITSVSFHNPGYRSSVSLRQSFGEYEVVKYMFIKSSLQLVYIS